MTLPDNDEDQLAQLGYTQELSRRMGGFSNFALSLSIICILAGGVTSFSQGFCAVGGAAIGIGWPLWTVLALVVAATMGQVASAFPTAGGLYHWAAILGGRGWGWVTAWFNLAGLIAVLAAINAGMVMFAEGVAGVKLSPVNFGLTVGLVTISHGLLNHFGIRVTTLLTDFSGWWILLVSAILTISLLPEAHFSELSRLVEFRNFSGPAGGDIIPESSDVPLLFLLALLLPAYTLTGFDASAHVAEETLDATVRVPRGIVRSVLVSGIFGGLMLCVVVLAMENPAETAAKGGDAFVFTLTSALPPTFAKVLLWAIVVAQYLCGLATVTSASRMVYAFARDGGLPKFFAGVSPRWKSPTAAIWLVAAAGILLMVLIPYATIAAVCAVLLYISYVLPSLLGAVAWNRTWTRFGPWNLGRWYRPLALLAGLSCLGLIWIGMQPPNEQAIAIVGGMLLLLAIMWFGFARKHFRGAPAEMLRQLR